MTSMLTPTNGNAAVIIGNRRRDDDFVVRKNIKSFINVPYVDAVDVNSQSIVENVKRDIKHFTTILTSNKHLIFYKTRRHQKIKR